MSPTIHSPTLSYLVFFNMKQRIEHKVQNYTVISALSSLLQGVTSTFSVMMILKFDRNVFCLLCFKKDQNIDKKN